MSQFLNGKRLVLYHSLCTQDTELFCSSHLKLNNGLVNWEAVQKKINLLEEENLSLKVEVRTRHFPRIKTNEKCEKFVQNNQ